jgi:hypothetical protein
MMAASLYIVVEGEDPGFDTFVNGRALARHEEALDKLANSLRVRSLLEFFSADENSMAMVLEQEQEKQEWGVMLPRPQWFHAHEGLATVGSLLRYLEENPAALGSESPAVRAELIEYETVLRKTEEQGLRWHLAVSFR